MRSPKDFFRPLAVGAPDPVREIPVRPSRMIHFFPPHLDKVVAKLPDIAAKLQRHLDAGADHVLVQLMNGRMGHPPLEEWRELAPALTAP